MFELTLNILNGKRRGKSFTIFSNGNQSHDRQDGYPYLQEDEAIEINLILPLNFKCISLMVYDAEVLYTKEEHVENGVCYTWSPNYRYSNPVALFQNFFGLAQIVIDVNTEAGPAIIEFEPIEILASKLSAKRVEGMLDYLSNLSDSYLLSAFCVTKKSGSIEVGDNSPEIIIEKIEKVTNYLDLLLPTICRLPLTKLNSGYQVRENKLNDVYDDNTISWLCNNLSILEPTDNQDDAIIHYKGEHYQSPMLEVPVLIEDTDIYENRVIHGFVENIIAEVRLLCDNLEHYSQSINNFTNHENRRYKSFFGIMSKFSHQLVRPKLKRCHELSDRLFKLKMHLNQYLPVSQSVRQLPRVSPKVRVNKPYMDIYYQILNWTETVKPNWLLYDNIMGIKSIPSLFEFYCFCRVSQCLNILFSENNDVKSERFAYEFALDNGNKVTLLKEPNYWTVNHKNSQKDDVVNTEGWTKYYDSSTKRDSINPRSCKGSNSRRAPDIVIKVVTPLGDSKLIVMDAKYTYSSKAFSEYLPQLTMKYVHGLHHKASSKAIVDSLTILYPDDFGVHRSFHHKDYAFDGLYPVKPALQTTSLVPNTQPVDDLIYLLERLLYLSGIDVTTTLTGF